ncbi:hypothetical protein N431DRAFT_54425 [Stipitochalara longipes BDJ]|nr:hypothetical protein N431DRAFT_54425 [Stipitochalara longipes BDJ]
MSCVSDYSATDDVGSAGRSAGCGWCDGVLGLGGCGTLIRWFMLCHGEWRDTLSHR